MVQFITNAQDNLLSKIATNNGHGESSSAYFDGWKAYDRDPFHPSSNPNGVLQMGLAENKLCFDLINDWIIKNPQASICTTEGVCDFKDIAIFQDYHGLPEFREAVANFMGKARGGKVKFDPDRIVMGGGSTGANETLMFCLADPGDAFLIPTPYYPAFDRDMGWRTRVKLIPVHCDSSSGFAVTRAAVEDAYNRAIAKNTRVKGLVLCNPSNPLGTILDKSTLTSLVRFVKEKNIHLVADEIYAATVFKSPEFVSVAEVVEEEAEYCNRDLIHVTYSLSKDLGVPGFRVGIVYSYNDQVVNCARKMSSFGLVSTQTQRLMAHMLSDDAFVERFLEESKKRLRHRQEHFTEGVARVGIRCLRSNAGLFVWMDLRHLLKETSLDGELALWRLIIHDMRINVSPGSSFHCSEPGWFRVCFANMDDETVEVALSRIRSFMLKGTCKGGNAKEDEKIVRSKKRSWQRSDLRLSFSGGARKYDDNVVVSSPLMMSPHSPLVKART